MALGPYPQTAYQAGAAMTTETVQGEEIRVEYLRQGDDIHHLQMGQSSLGDITIDYTGIPPKDRTSTAAKLLCASVIYCYASTLAAAMNVRGAQIKSLTGRAIATKGKDVFYKTKVNQITVELDVEIDDAHLPILEKCKRIMENGCLISYSVDQGIEVQHVINRRD
jgi:osmotically inducible protein OsmC